MQEKDFSSVCNLMYNAKRIFVYGTGAVQSSVAAELKRIFLSGQECIYNIQGEAEADMILNTISDEDLIFLISNLHHLLYLKSYQTDRKSVV